MLRSRVRVTLVAGLAAGVLVGFSGCAGSPSGSADRSPTPAGAELVGPAPADSTVPVIVRLAQQAGPDEMSRRAASPENGAARVGASKRVAAETGASDATVNSVEGFFASRGLSARVDPTRTYASLRVTPAQARDLFGVDLAEYRDLAPQCAAGNQAPPGCMFVAPEPDASAKVPAQLLPALASGPVAKQVGGFENRQVFSAHAATPSIPAQTPTQGPAPSPSATSDAITDGLDPSSPPWWNPSGTQDGCAEAKQTGSFTPNQLAAAYGFPSGTKGLVPQTVALIALGGKVDPNSVSVFAKCFGMAVPKFEMSDYADNPLPGGEATADAQTLVAYGGPAIGTIHVVTGETPGTSASDLLHAISAAAALTDGEGKPVDVISISHAACEADFASQMGSTIEATETVLAKAAAAGITVAAASGDAGSSACSPAGQPDVAPAVNYPASSAWVTAVGGTDLMLGKDNSISFSGVWNDAVLVQDGDQIYPNDAGGGGVSKVIDRPTWQAGPGVDEASKRQVPDVAYMASLGPGIAGYCAPGVYGCGGVNWFQNGGTSLSTPMFAAAVAQYNARHDNDRLGFANPKLYPAVASGKVKTYDIVSGNNITGWATYNPFRLPDRSCCFATPHFDTASGWGSVMIDSMIGGLG